MTGDKRKRGADATSAAAVAAAATSSAQDPSSSSSSTLQAVTDPGPSKGAATAATNTAAGNRGAPFFTGAAIYKALDTSSADSLRQALHQLRIQTNLTFSEQSNPSTIPPSDPRIKVVQEYCQLCQDQAVENPATTAARSIFAAWDLAYKQSLGPLLPLPIFTLAHFLPLLSAHWPTQSLGENIIDRLLSPSEPWFDLLQNYVSNSTSSSAAAAKSKGRDQSHLNTDVAVIASLLLLKEMASFGRGRFASRVFARFNWALKSLPKLLNRRRRRFADRTSANDGEGDKKADKGKARSKQPDPSQHDHGATSLERPDIRTLYLLFLLAFLGQTYSSSPKVMLLGLGRDHLPQMLKGLVYDPPDVVHHILVTLHEDLVCDAKIPRARKAAFLNEWACACVIKLYARDDERISVDEDGVLVQGSSVAELAHHFLLSISTHAGFGICYADRGWFPRPSTSTGSAANDNDAAAAALDGLLEEGRALGDEDAEDEDEVGGIARIGGGSRSSRAQTRHIYNKALSGVLPRLSVTEDLLQQELALGILRACPELVGPYLESGCGGLTLEPRTSSRWLCNAAYLTRVLSLELPSFRNARLQRAAGGGVSDSVTARIEPSLSSSSAAAAPTSYFSAYSSHPPPLATIISNTLPTPLSRQLFTRGLHNPDRLVRHTTAKILCRCLERLLRFRRTCDEAALELDEGDNGPWRSRARIVEIEARKRLPEISIVIQLMQDLTASSSVPGLRSGPLAEAQSANVSAPPAAAATAAVDADDSAAASSAELAGPNSNVLLVEASLRLLWLYYLAVPSSALDTRFDVGKLLTNSFMAPLRRATLDEDGEPEKLNLQALCQVHALRIVALSTDLLFDWSAKAAGVGANIAAGPGFGASKAPVKSYLGLLLTIYVTTPLDQVKTSCEELFERLIGPSSLFEHDPSELSAWLESLPRTDVNTAVIAASASASIDGGEGNDSDAMAATVSLVDSLSEDQAHVLALLDECAQRCMKTPYRYIEASRKFFREQSPIEDGYGILDEVEGVYDESQEEASPLLMTILEQFTIRARKGVLGEPAAVEALLAFFGRLLPNIVGSGGSLRAYTRMAQQIVEAAEAHATYKRPTIAHLCKTLLASLDKMREAPWCRSDDKEAWTIEETTITNDGDAFAGAASPTELRRLLRSAARPLSRNRVRSLYQAADAFHHAGHSGALQVLHELHAQDENLMVALSPHTFFAVKLGRLPLTHILNGVPLPADDKVDALVDADAVAIVTDLEELEAWTSPLQTKFAATMAVERLSVFMPGSDPYLNSSPTTEAQTSSILCRVISSRVLDAVDLDRLIFAKAALLFCLRSCETPVLQVALADVVSEVMRPTSDEDQDLVSPIFDILLASIAADTRSTMNSHDFAPDRIRALLKLLPFAKPDALPKVLNLLLESLVANDYDEEPKGFWALRLEALVLCAGLDSADATKQRLAEKVVVLEDVASQMDEAGNNEAARLVRSLLDHVASIAPPRIQGAVAAADAASSSASADIDADALASVPPMDKIGGNPAAAKASLDLLLPVISKLGLEAASATAYSALSDLLAAAQPRDAFTSSLLALASSILAFSLSASATDTDTQHSGNEMEKAAAIVQTVLDKGLLFLVRRFAEDDDDDNDLVERIEAFVRLIEDVSHSARARGAPAVTVKAHLADPVIEAALKNRMLNSAPMRLVLALCRTASALKVPQLSRYVSTLTAHGEFTAVATETETAIQIIHAIVSRHPKELLTLPLMTKLLSIYGGTLSRADRCLLDLFRLFEEECGSSFLSLARHWASPAAGLTSDALSSQSKVVEALLSVDPTVALATCTEFPRSIPLRRSARYGYVADVDDGVTSSGHSDATTRYDPFFLLSLLAGSLAEYKVTGFEWLQLLRTNVLGVAICGLSSRCNDMRKACLELLGKAYASVSESGFGQRDYVLLALDLLRGCIPKAAFDDAQRGWEAPPSLPLTTTLFVAHTLRSVGHPSLFTFLRFQKFLLQRPMLDATDVPLLYNMLYSSTDMHRQERIWMLRFLRDVARAGGKAEWKVWKRRHVWELLTSLYDSVASGGLAATSSTGMGQHYHGVGREVEDAEIVKALVEDTLIWLARVREVATELVVRRGVVAWIAEKVNRASVRSARPRAFVAAAVDEGEAARTREEELSVWLSILRELLDHVDFDEWQRTTSGTWRTTVRAIVEKAMAPPRSTEEAAVAEVEEVTKVLATCRALLERVNEPVI